MCRSDQLNSSYLLRSVRHESDYDASDVCPVLRNMSVYFFFPLFRSQRHNSFSITGATGLTAGSASFYNPFSLGGMSSTGLDQYPLAQFIGRSIYETGRETRDQHENVNMSRDPATATHFKGAWSPRF